MRIYKVLDEKSYAPLIFSEFLVNSIPEMGEWPMADIVKQSSCLIEPKMKYYWLDLFPSSVCLRKKMLTNEIRNLYLYTINKKLIHFCIGIWFYMVQKHTSQMEYSAER